MSSISTDQKCADKLNKALNRNNSGAQCVSYHIQPGCLATKRGHFLVKCQIDSHSGSVSAHMNYSTAAQSVDDFVVTDNRTGAVLAQMAEPGDFENEASPDGLQGFSPVILYDAWRELVPDMSADGVCRALVDEMQEF